MRWLSYHLFHLCQLSQMSRRCTDTGRNVTATPNIPPPTTLPRMLATKYPVTQPRLMIVTHSLCRLCTQAINKRCGVSSSTPSMSGTMPLVFPLLSGTHAGGFSNSAAAPVHVEKVYAGGVGGGGLVIYQKSCCSRRQYPKQDNRCRRSRGSGAYCLRVWESR